MLAALILSCFINIYGASTTGLSSQNYPHYLSWNVDKQTFEPGYLSLPENSPSLRSDFQTATPSHAWRSFSQYNQDIIVNTIFNDMEGGFYVDLAANSWKELSNTYLLEAFNHWKGICIEALAAYHRELLMNRRCQLFINPVSYKDNEKLIFFKGGAFSGIVGKEFDRVASSNNETSQERFYTELIAVRFTTILDFAKAPKVMQYLSLDIEGAEYYAMKGFDFDRYTFLVMTIERPKAKLHYLLTRNGYLFVNVLTGIGETLYVHHSLSNLKEVWKKFHQDLSHRIWMNQTHDYLNEPVWTWNITAYLTQAKILYEKHHHSSSNP